ncbi:hypothetical protein BDQ17DRAFT_1425628 [Cyathus striatus]|nr:hypothetical protein BDQ17DRAFT_1425628 [Cyathus striatus]
MAPNKNTNNTSTDVSSPHSHSVEPAAKKGKKGRHTKGRKTAADKEEEDEAASSTKDTEIIIKEIGLTVVPPACVMTTETSGTTTEATTAAGVAIEAATINTEITQASEITLELLLRLVLLRL